METCTYIDAEFLDAAEKGILAPFKNCQQPVDSLLSPNKNTILHIYLSTLSERSTEFIKEVLSICPLLLWKVNVHGDTPLHIAARYGHADAAKELIEQAKASTHNKIQHTRESIEQINASDSERREGSRESIEQANASDSESGEGSRESIEQANASTHNEIDLESGEGSRESIEQANASTHNEIDLESGEGPRESEMEAVRKMLRMTNKNKETALHEAARNERSLGVVEAIMSNEDPREFTYSANNRGETPLYLAVKNRNGRIACALLLHYDSELLAYGGPNGKTALHEASVLDCEDDDFTNKGKMDQTREKIKFLLDREIQSSIGLTKQLRERLNSLSCQENVRDNAQSSIGLKEQFSSILREVEVKDDAQSLIGLMEQLLKKFMQLWKKFKSLLGKKNVMGSTQVLIDDNSELTEKLRQILKHLSPQENVKDDVQSLIGLREQLKEKLNSLSRQGGVTDDEQSVISKVIKCLSLMALWTARFTMCIKNDKYEDGSPIELFIQIMLTSLMRLTKETDEKGWTPLHYAAYSKKQSAVEFLLDNDISSAYIADKDWKRTALHIAACRGFQCGMEKIISVCPTCCEITDIRGWNVIHYAVISQNDKVLKAVLQKSSLIHLLNEKDVKGYTPVHLYKACHSRLPYFMQHGDTDMFKHWRTLHKQIQNERDFPLKKNEIVAWMKDLGTGPLGKIEMQNIEGSKTKENMILKFEKVKDSHLVAAVLIATVTFAAMFTVPGGYVSDENNLKKGTPILSGNSAFTAFMISDTIAMVLSTSCVFIHFILVMLGYLERYYWLIKCAFSSLFYAMVAMVITFVTGAYAVLAPPFGYGVCAIGLSFFCFIFYSIISVTWSLFLSEDDDDEEVNSYKQQINTFSWLTGGIFWLGFLFIALPLELRDMFKKFKSWWKE